MQAPAGRLPLELQHRRPAVPVAAGVLVDVDVVEKRRRAAIHVALREPQRADRLAIRLDHVHPVVLGLEALWQHRREVTHGLRRRVLTLHAAELDHLVDVAPFPLLRPCWVLVRPHRPQRHAHSATRWNRMWSRHVPAIRRYSRARPMRSNPFFSSTRCEATLSTSVPASSRCMPSGPNACSAARPTARVATPRPLAAWATKYPMLPDWNTEPTTFPIPSVPTSLPSTSITNL